MALKVGLVGLQNQINSNTQTVNNLTGFNSDQINNIFIIGRVTNVVCKKEDVDENTWKNNGEYQLIGSVGFIDITQNIQNSVTSPTPQTATHYAKPLLPFQKYIPCVNEIILIISSIDSNIQTGKQNPKFYYLGTINIWNSPHHNATPFTINTKSPQGQNKSYGAIEAGGVNKVIGNTFNTQIKLGIEESSDISPTQPYIGDYITEGRWGNSIRLGSTVKDKQNPWSKEGKIGSPIMIFSNGQVTNTNNTSYIPITENINTDLSSIWLTSTQKIPITTSQFKTDSYTNYIPIKPNEYKDSQIILNSNRLLFNSNKDHILLNSALTIGFNSVRGFNFDTPASFVVKAPQIKMGDKEATEPMLLGNKTINTINVICDELIKLSIPLSSLAEILPASAKSAVNIAAANMTEAINIEKNKLNELKSKTNFLI